MFSSSAGVRLGDLGFGRPISFDANALSGFSSVFLRRADRTEPGSSFTSLFDIDVILETVRRRFDVLWLHGYYSPTHLMAAATQIVLGRRLLVREEQTLLTTRPAWRSALKKPLLRVLFSRSHGLFIGKNNRQWFRYYGMPDERLFHVPFCVDNEFFLAEARRLSSQRARIREALGVPAKGPVILSIARLVPKKQPLVLLEAFRRLRASHQCTLLVVGAGPCEEEMRDFVKKIGIPRRRLRRVPQSERGIAGIFGGRCLRTSIRMGRNLGRRRERSDELRPPGRRLGQGRLCRRPRRARREWLRVPTR